jgi:hypothetical protein
MCDNIKNFDKLKTDADRELVKRWSKITNIEINDDGFYTLNMLPLPSNKEAILIPNK